MKKVSKPKKGLLETVLGNNQFNFDILTQNEKDAWKYFQDICKAIELRKEQLVADLSRECSDRCSMHMPYGEFMAVQDEKNMAVKELEKMCDEFKAKVFAAFSKYGNNFNLVKNFIEKNAVLIH
ncbi:MAG: hypothetical protein LBL46_01015 [Rickettsiales bacterium]|jgi:hypothetical protein|nr:hypothetical protein [Rickettsiales bacterium]